MRMLLTWADRLLIPFAFAVLLWAGLRTERSGGIASIIWSDAEGYYMYLPATFVQGDWHVWDGKDGLEMLSCCAVSDSGLVKTRYTYGVAAMQAPFFFVAHGYARAFHGPGTPPPADWEIDTGDEFVRAIHHRKYHPERGSATGFSDIYGAALLIAAAFYTALGLWFVRGTLRRYLSPAAALLTTVVVLGATNLYYYASVEGSMSHAFSFCLFAAFGWMVPRWLERPRWSLSLGLGACIALIFLIRPTNVLIALLLPLWEVYSWAACKARLRLLLQHAGHLAAMALMAGLLLLPQFLYWRLVWGDWVVWSYEGEGFSNALHPKVLQVLFSHQNGLFLYTPVMLLAMVGLGMGIRKRQNSAPAILLVFLLSTYVFASWWAWWFGGAFGHRCYVELYAVLALPLGSAVQGIWEDRRAWLRWGGLLLLMGFVYANLKMTALYQPPWDGPAWTMDSYLGVLRQVARIWWWPG